MKAKEFGARQPYNDFKSGQRYSANGYNKSFKKERFPSTQEYANKNLDEYHRFEETKDFTKEPATKESDGRQSNQSKKTDNARKMRQRMLQQVVGITVGSTVVVTSYQAQVEERAKQEVFEPTVAVTETIDMPITEDDILDEIVDLESDNNEQSATANSDGGRARGGSGNGGRSGGSGNGRSSSTANSDTAEADVQDDAQDPEVQETDEQEVDVQEPDVLETDDSENIDENAETLPDDNIDGEEEQDADEQDTDSSDEENPENDENPEDDASETETPFAAEIKKETTLKQSRTSASWEWSPGNADASYVIKTESGTVVESMPVTVTSVEEPATCTEDGKITYTAKLDIGGTEFTDVKEEILPALGHSFGSGQEIIEGGKKFIQFECSRCGKHLKIGNSISEE